MTVEELIKAYRKLDAEMGDELLCVVTSWKGHGNFGPGIANVFDISKDIWISEGPTIRVVDRALEPHTLRVIWGGSFEAHQQMKFWAGRSLAWLKTDAVAERKLFSAVPYETAPIAEAAKIDAAATWCLLATAASVEGIFGTSMAPAAQSMHTMRFAGSHAPPEVSWIRADLVRPFEKSAALLEVLGGVPSRLTGGSSPVSPTDKDLRRKPQVLDVGGPCLAVLVIGHVCNLANVCNNWIEIGQMGERRRADLDNRIRLANTASRVADGKPIDPLRGLAVPQWEQYSEIWASGIDTCARIRAEVKRAASAPMTDSEQQRAQDILAHIADAELLFHGMDRAIASPTNTLENQTTKLKSLHEWASVTHGELHGELELKAYSLDVKRDVPLRDLKYKNWPAEISNVLLAKGCGSDDANFMSKQIREALANANLAAPVARPGVGVSWKRAQLRAALPFLQHAKLKNLLLGSGFGEPE